MGCASVDRPLLSFIVIAYNQEAYIRSAVQGAFSQTYSPLESFCPMTAPATALLISWPPWPRITKAPTWSG